MEKRAVLFVDDDEIILKSIEKSTANESYDTYFARSGEEAIEILRQEVVHVIVVDIMMPGMDGIELVGIIKRDYPDIVYIVITGHAQSATVMMEMSDLGIYRFISKSLTFEQDLRIVIRKAIDSYNKKLSAFLYNRQHVS
ncbi:MAG: response regulator [Planctomycetota bacterium]|jgi:DNA-binding NtrC family response regulator